MTSYLATSPGKTNGTMEVKYNEVGNSSIVSIKESFELKILQEPIQLLQIRIKKIKQQNIITTITIGDKRLNEISTPKIFCSSASIFLNFII